MKEKTPPGGPPVIKWSSKPADHNAVRVRNNQRRHRARAKEHVQDLERRLEETSARLEAALQTISHLAREVEMLRGRVGLATPAWPQLPAPTTTTATMPPPVVTGPGPDPDTAEGLDVEAGGAAESTTLQTSLRPETEAPGPTDRDIPPTTTTAASATTADAGDGGDGGTDCGCEDGRLPPQAPGESTLPCSSAFSIIEQQSFSGVEVTTIRAWLGPGFRRPLRPGEACRVETNRVYELLDHITSSS